MTVCRKYYIHPAVLTAYTEGELFRVVDEAQRTPQEGLYADETAVRELLRGYSSSDASSPAVKAEVQETLAVCN